MRLFYLRRLRFSLFSFMLFMTVSRLVLGWFGRRYYWASRQLHAVVAIRAAGGDVNYASGRDSFARMAGVGFKKSGGPTFVPTWQERWFGRDFADPVVCVYFPNDSTDPNPAIKYLPGCPHVRGLMLTHVPLSEDSLAVLGRLPRLENIGWWFGSSPPAPALEMATRLTNVRNLSLWHTKAIGDEEIRLIARMTGLRHLSVVSTGVTDAGLVHLAGLPNLEMLTLDGTAITDAGLATLATFPRLKSLNLGETAVTDQALAQLLKFKNLESLQLYRTAISDGAIEMLMQLKSLRSLSLEGSKVSADGKAQVHRALVGCVVE